MKYAAGASTDRVFFVYSESKIALPLRTIQGLLSVLSLIPRFILVLIPILVIFPEVFWIVVVIADVSGIAVSSAIMERLPLPDEAERG